MDLKTKEDLYSAANIFKETIKTLDSTQDNKFTAIQHVARTIAGILQQLRYFEMKLEDLLNLRSEIIKEMTIKRVKFKGEDITAEVVSEFEKLTKEINK